MELLQYCLTAYTKNPQLARLNGTPGNIDNITRMLTIVKDVIEDASVDAQGNKAQFPSLKNLTLSTNDEFNSKKPADIIALVFEVATENNHNPQLWSEGGDGGIHGHLKTTLRNFIFGPHAFNSDPRQGVHETHYSKAKEKLTEYVNTRGPF